MVPRNRTIFLVALLVLASTGLVWIQYVRFRSPAPVTRPFGPFSAYEENGVRRIVPAREILPAGPEKDGMPPIDQPTFAPVAVADQYLKDDGFGIDVATAGKRRFYPFQMLVWHLVVNDEVDGKPVLVAFCPLCQSGGVYSRLVGDAVLSFGTAGMVWNNISLLYDKTGSTLWTAAGGLALQGMLAGDRLTPLPSRIVRWDEWKRAYPTGLVLARVPGASRDYTLDPYGTYPVNREIPFPLNRLDARLPVKTLVYGVAAGEGSIAFSAEDVRRADVIQEDVGGIPAVVWQDVEADGVAAFDRRTADKTLTFYRSKNGNLTDRETGSLWNEDGVAYAGPLKKMRLDRLPVDRTFWFCWAALHPGTTVYSLP